MNVQEISPEAAVWVARRGMVLDYLNEQQPVDQRHNKRMAADLIRLMQEWDANTERTASATFRERYDLLRKVERVRAIVDRVAADPSNATDELWVYSIRKALDGEQ